jgi:hypothetical protein
MVLFAERLGDEDEIQAGVEGTEAVARRVVELLEADAGKGPELVDAAELARRLAVRRSWIYEHASELGAVKLGHGPRPRLRFEPRVVIERLREGGKREDGISPAIRQRRRSSASPARTGLLPIKQRGAN